MAGKYGVSELVKLAADAASVMNIASKGGIVALFGLAGVLADLRSVDFSEVKSEIGELDAEDRSKVEFAFAGALDLENKEVQAKIISGLSCIDDGFAMAAEAMQLYAEALALEAKLKALVS